MDGFDLVFLEVGTRDKSSIAELTIITARSTWRAPAPSSGEAALLFDRAGRKRALTLLSSGALRKWATA